VAELVSAPRLPIWLALLLLLLLFFIIVLVVETVEARDVIEAVRFRFKVVNSPTTALRAAIPVATMLLSTLSTEPAPLAFMEGG
jgi:hypothetical protein